MNFANILSRSRTECRRKLIQINSTPIGTIQHAGPLGAPPIRTRSAPESQASIGNRVDSTLHFAREALRFSPAFPGPTARPPREPRPRPGVGEALERVAEEPALGQAAQEEAPRTSKFRLLQDAYFRIFVLRRLRNLAYHLSFILSDRQV